MKTIIKHTEGYAIDGDEGNWTAQCPDCEKEFEYIGYFDSQEKTQCSCGCVFVIDKIWLDENEKEFIY